MTATGDRVEALQLELLVAEQKLREAKLTYEAVSQAKTTAGAELDDAIERASTLAQQLRESRVAHAQTKLPPDWRSDFGSTAERQALRWAER